MYVYTFTRIRALKAIYIYTHFCMEEYAYISTSLLLERRLQTQKRTQTGA